MIDINEAPKGFYAVNKKESKTANVCWSCDARSLCIENKENWCLINRCMSYEIEAKDGRTYSRADKESVFFKFKTELQQQKLF